ncbi:hypothetical protein FVEN_g12539 [Fusarium venenatum]|uniref:Uncharacterized protein n=2 Tax=Fusarium venenatum TaxID=56646 RepID=A0A2L2SPN2_9HYPO|nr:uncharacterized protein FVRRES_11202 [Fusarium venenatum]KAG8349235.1 hypothetical protein FVEN_g12539 [Fusarium venenatum]CEI38511.1 unnamed protein product [Fusarium venenatum]
MATERRITDLPLEIRQQIFREYFKVQGGYVYNSQSDKLRNADDTLIDLSLICTCRSIANDCKHLPLAVNTIHFSTLYREDWRSLAGCFNLVAAYYYVLQQDIVLHLAHLITPEMHAQLENKFPGFRSKLDAERTFHFRTWDTGDRTIPDQDLDNTSTSNHMRPAVCQFVRDFYDFEISEYDKNHPYPRPYQGYAGALEYPGPSFPRDYRPDSCEEAYQQWDKYSGEVRQCLTHCLRLIADENPEEFSNRVYTSLPHWIGKYSAKEFFDLRFDCWAIPSQSQVQNAMERLYIPDFVWKLPNLWSYSWKPKQLDKLRSLPKSYFLEDYEHPPFQFNARGRGLARFSAAATAIRFLSILPNTQRTQTRALILHEDSPSVNRSSLHCNGLIPFFKENPLLQVERRFNIVNAVDITGSYGNVDEVMSSWAQGSCETIFDDEAIITNMSRWLLDTIATCNEGIPTGSLTLLLESDPYTDFCTEAFQELIHSRIAQGHAIRDCLELGLFKHLTSKQVEELRRQFTFEDGFEEAMVHLVNKTSTVFRCDFNPGVPEDCQKIVNDMKATSPADIWKYWETKRLALGYVDLPVEWTREMISKVYEIETEDEHFQARSCDSEQCRFE